MKYTAYLLAAALCIAPAFGAQTVPDTTTPTNDAPNPYKTITGNFKLPDGRSWGSTSLVDIDRDGKTIWTAERCGQNTCYDPKTKKIADVDPILHYDTNGKLLGSFGKGLMITPHGIYVDKDDNIWVTDYQDNGTQPARGTPRPAGPVGPPADATIGNQVWKFSPTGQVLLKLGKPGGAASPGYFYAPNDVITAPNGDIFVSEGHGSGNNRVLKFDPTGKFIKEWGKLGTGPGEFDQPHALAFDSQGHLFIGDRNNNRVQEFDQDGNFIAQFHQWSRPSGIFITKDDMLYVADSESESVSKNHDGWRRGIRWGSLKDGKIIGFIPDPVVKANGTSAAEGVAVDSAGNIYGAEVGPKELNKYVKN